jgi:hypothetical protein
MSQLELDSDKTRPVEMAVKSFEELEAMLNKV